MNLASALSDLPAVQGQPPWPGYEYVKGWGVFALPFDSGHVLALRVFPESSFGPYASLWHRDPIGRWSIYVDGERLDTACPRYFGPACVHTDHARLDLRWTGPASIRVTMEAPWLEWTLTASSTRLLDSLNALGARLPLATWRSAPMVHARERLAQTLGMGRLHMSGVMPSGHVGTLMPQRMYLVDEARAVLDGVDLGHPARLAANPAIGDVPLPARGVLAVGGAVFRPLHEAQTVDASTTRHNPSTATAFHS